MKRIGMTSGGTHIVEMNGSDFEFLGKMVAALRPQLPVSGTDGAALMGDLPKAPVSKKPARPKAKKKASPPANARKCIICGKPMPAALNKLAKCCSKACLAEKNRRYSAAWYRRKYGVPSATKAARLEALRASAKRIQERDPVETAAAKALQIRKEECAP